MLGATTSAYHIQPDLAIVVDVTFAVGDGISEAVGFALGSGPAIGLGANIHTKLFNRLRDTARNTNTDFNVEPLARDSGTEARVVQVSRAGIPTALLSIPIRNMHTPVEIVSLNDVEHTGRLLAEFIVGLDHQAIDSLTLAQAQF